MLRRVDRLRDRRSDHAGVHGRRRVAFAEDHRRDALRDHADDAAVAVSSCAYDWAWMSMTPGATTSPRASIRRLALARSERAAWRDARDAIAGDADVAVEPGVAGAVDDLAVRDDDVVRRVACGRRDGTRSASTRQAPQREKPTKKGPRACAPNHHCLLNASFTVHRMEAKRAHERRVSWSNDRSPASNRWLRVYTLEGVHALGPHPPGVRQNDYIGGRSVRGRSEARYVARRRTGLRACFRLRRAQIGTIGELIALTLLVSCLSCSAV